MLLLSFSIFSYSIQGSVKISPGRVCSLKLCPTDPQKLLIGYEKGIIVLWNIDQGVPERNFPASILDTQQVSRERVTPWVGVCLVTKVSE